MDAEQVAEELVDDAELGFEWPAPGSEADWRMQNASELSAFTLEAILEVFAHRGYDFDFGRTWRYPQWLLAEAFLFVVLRHIGSSPARDLTAHALEIGLNESSLRAARTKLRVLTEKRGGVRHGGWWWRLPPQLRSFDALIDFDLRWGWWLQFR